MNARIQKIAKARQAGENTGKFINTAGHMTAEFAKGCAQEAFKPLTDDEKAIIAKEISNVAN